jgi:putative ABC transport system permease protein
VPVRRADRHGLGIGAAVLIGDMAGWPVFIGPDAMAFAIGFSAAVGLFFGWYPARKAPGSNRSRR